MKLNKYIDHTLLKPFATTDDIKVLCEEALKYDFKAVCVPPYYLEICNNLLRDSDVGICTVVGFPFGYTHIGTKLDEIKRAIDTGVDELDVVNNICAVKNKEWRTVESELDSIMTMGGIQKNKTVKLILETAYLTDEELKKLCQLCVAYKVDFAKTSTGYAPEGANVEVITKMKKYLDGKVAIKASGGIKTKTLAKELIKAGATRLGTSSGVKLVK